MAINTGIWIDSRTAVIIHLSGDSHKVIHLNSLIETREREEGESKKFGRFGDQYLSFEKTKRNKQINQAKEFLKHIKLHLKKSNSFVVFGPAQMKIELEKDLKEDKVLYNKLMSIESADSMTENQMIAWVKGYFS